MGYRFRKSFKIGPVRTTISKSGVSYSVGTKHSRITKTAKGDIRRSVHYGPISYSEKIGSLRSPQKSQTQQTVVTSTAETVTRKYQVAGESFHRDEILQLMHLNPDYRLPEETLIKKYRNGGAVYKYRPPLNLNVSLEPEPDNPHDKNAVKVILNGRHVGYIKRGSAAHIRNLLQTRSISHMEATLGGGPCIELERYGDDPDDVTMEIYEDDDEGELDFSATVIITEPAPKKKADPEPAAPAQAKPVEFASPGPAGSQSRIRTFFKILAIILLVSLLWLLLRRYLS